MEYDAKVTNSPRRGFQTFLHFQQICRSCRNPICTLSQRFELHTGSFGHPTFWTNQEKSWFWRFSSIDVIKTHARVGQSFQQGSQGLHHRWKSQGESYNKWVRNGFMCNSCHIRHLTKCPNWCHTWNICFDLIFSWKMLKPNFAFWDIFLQLRCLNSKGIKLQRSIRVICIIFDLIFFQLKIKNITNIPSSTTISTLCQASNMTWRAH